MRKIIHKWFSAWDFDKEEKWLNEMASKGLSLVAIGYCKYTFQDCRPGEYAIRIELLENMADHAESQQYIKFVEETGAEYLGSMMRWVYFRKRISDGEFDLYSDNASRVKHLNLILSLLGVISLLHIGFGMANLSMFFCSQNTPNLIFALLYLSLGLRIGFGYLRTNRKKQKLKKEQQIFE